MFWFFLPTLAAAGYFSEHVHRYVNHAIEPCDDFYDHVCTSAIKERRFFIEDGPKRFKSVLNQISSLEIRKFRMKLEDDRANHSNESMSKEDSEALKNFLSKASCNFKCNYDGCKGDFEFFEGIEAYDAFHRLQFTPYFSTIKKKMEEIFSVLKEILITDFTKAVWTKWHPGLLNALKTVHLMHSEVENLQLEEVTAKIKEKYEACLSVTSNLTRLLVEKCLSFAVCSSRMELDAKIMVDFITSIGFDAEFTKPDTITMSPMFFTLEEDDLPYMLGSVDFVLAHEIGHVFFHEEARIHPLNSECFRKHMQKACDTFSVENNCSAYNNKTYFGNESRFHDDAADWIGLHAGLKALRQYFPKVFPDESLLNCPDPKSIEIIKKYLYAFGITWCNDNPKLANEEHSPPKLRVNGIASLFSEFSEVFQCKRGSEMYKPATCLPFAGIGAPTRRSHQNRHKLE